MFYLVLHPPSHPLLLPHSEASIPRHTVKLHDTLPNLRLGISKCKEEELNPLRLCTEIWFFILSHSVWYFIAAV